MSKKETQKAVLSRRDMLAASAAITGHAAFASSASAKTGAVKQKTPKFDLDRFVDDCVKALDESDPQAAVKEVLARAVSMPGDVLKAVGEPQKAGINPIYRSKKLTIFNAVWTPQMNLVPHNHLMWALIGIYAGREDNIFWRRSTDSVEAFSAKALFERDVASLPADAIHSVTNPLLRFTGGIHIYGGDFFDTTRSQWDAETLAEEPSDGDVIKAIFERENERFNECART